MRCVTRSCPRSRTARYEIAQARHSSFYAPRDFDISPYFMVVKPTLAHGFNYKDMHWADLPRVHTAEDRARPRWRTRQSKRAAIVCPYMNRWPANERGAVQYPYTALIARLTIAVSTRKCED